MNLIRKFLIVFFLIGSGIVQAEDARIVTEFYTPYKVFNVYTKVGKASLIQFEEGETLDTSSSLLGLGDKEAWELGVRGNNIALKPKKLMPSTNLIIVTNKRTYSFELKNIRTGVVTYILRFNYTAKAKLSQQGEFDVKDIERIQQTANAKAEKKIRNTDYVWRGDAELLKPTSAYDNGRFTYLIYDNAASMPNFYKVLPNGKEALLNTSIEGNKVKVHEINSVIKARLDDSVIEIINKSYVLPKFNEYGTGKEGALRLDKGLLK